MDVYFSSKQFLDDQIRILNAPLRVDLDSRNAILRSPEGETEDDDDEQYSSDNNDEFERSSSNKKPTKNKKARLTSQGLDKIISKVNQKKKVYYGKIFTQQAKKHVIMQLQAASADSFLEAHEKVESMKSRLFVSVDPDISSLATSTKSGDSNKKLQTRLEGLSKYEIHNLSESLVNGHNGNSAHLSKALKRYNEAVAKHRKYAEVKNNLKSTFSDSPQESIQKNLITTQSPVLDELAKLRTLCAKLQSKLNSNPETLKLLLEDNNKTNSQNQNDSSKRLKVYEKTI